MDIFLQGFQSWQIARLGLVSKAGPHTLIQHTQIHTYLWQALTLVICYAWKLGRKQWMGSCNLMGEETETGETWIKKNICWERERKKQWCLWEGERSWTRIKEEYEINMGVKIIQLLSEKNMLKDQTQIVLHVFKTPYRVSDQLHLYSLSCPSSRFSL